ncbi:hypothetical protein GCM10009857_17410 [Agromyces soli]
MNTKGSRVALAGAAAGIALAIGSAATPAFAYWSYSGGYSAPRSACITEMRAHQQAGYTILQGCTKYYASQGGWLLDTRIWVP